MIPIQSIAQQYGHPMAIVVQCCRVYFNTANINELNELIQEGEVDWAQVALTAHNHWIKPVVFRVLVNGANLPVSFADKFKRELQITTIKALNTAKETERLILFLQNAGIQALPYKGVAFSKQFYGDIAMRESSDIDLIIDPEDLPAAIALLNKEGFVNPYHSVYERIGPQVYIEDYKDYTLDGQSGNIERLHLELHWKMLGTFYGLPKRELYFKTSPTENIALAGKELRFLSKEEHARATLLHHIIQDRIGYLKTIVDISCALRELKNPKELFNNDAVAQLHTDYCINVTNEILGSLPTIKTNTSNKPFEEKLCRIILNSEYEKSVENKIPIISSALFYFDTLGLLAGFIKKRSQKMKMILTSILMMIQPGALETNFIKLPKQLYFLYYIIRPFRLILKPYRKNKI